MKRATKAGLALLGALVIAQLVSCERTNPPVTGEIVAPPEVKTVLRRACYDCHSNETRWPWYSRVAPMSWLVHRDVSEGRKHLNFSEWKALPLERRKRRQRSVGKDVETGKMPLWFYIPLHAEARLSDAEKQLIEQWAKGPISE